jgi:SAM-dependent methyltransferase
MPSESKLLRPIDLRRDVRARVVAMFRYLPQDAVIYDVGCGSKPFENPLSKLPCRYIGVDTPNGFYGTGKVDLIGSAYDVPAAGGSADAVLCSQVLEHLERPVDALREAHRLLRPGGIMILSFPLLYPLHAAPHDYGRYTRYFVRSTVETIGFDVVEEEAIGGFWYAAGFAAGLYLLEFDRGVVRRIALMRLLIAAIQWTCRALHSLEGWLLTRFGRDARRVREAWTVNYVFALAKRAA